MYVCVLWNDYTGVRRYMHGIDFVHMGCSVYMTIIIITDSETASLLDN